MMNKFFLLTASAICMLLLGSCDGDSDDDVISDIEFNSGVDVNSKTDNNLSAKQVDMTVVVPIHPSSMEYFDYIIHYYDNQGAEYRDTIQETSGGIVVEDWNYVDIETTLEAEHQDTIQGEHTEISVEDWACANAVVEPTQTSDLEYFDYIIRHYDNQDIVRRDTIQKSRGGASAEEWNYEQNASLCATNSSLTSNNCYIRTFSYDNLYVTCTMTVEMVPKKDSATKMAFSFYVPKPYIFPRIHNSTTSVISEMVDHAMENVECIRIDSMTVSSFQSTYGKTFSSHCGIYDSYVGYEIFFY